MTYDFNTAGGEAVLLDQFGFDQRNRYPYTTGPSQTNITSTSTALTTMSQGNRQSLSLSPETPWLPLDMAGGVGAAGVSLQSPNAGSLSASSPEDLSKLGSQSPDYHSSASSPLQQQQSSPFPPAPHTNPTSFLADWTLQQSQFIPQAPWSASTPIRATSTSLRDWISSRAPRSTCNLVYQPWTELPSITCPTTCPQ